MQGQPALCLGPAPLSPSLKESIFPHGSQQHIWRRSSKICWAACTQAIIEISDSLCIAPSLDIVELQLLLLWRNHGNCLHFIPPKVAALSFAAWCALAGSTAAQWQPPLVCQIPEETTLLWAPSATCTAPNATPTILCHGQGDIAVRHGPAVLLGHARWKLHQLLPFLGSRSAQMLS